jgi:hypothetical protein
MFESVHVWAPSLTVVHLPIALGLESHLKQAVLGIVTLAATGTRKIATPGRSLMIIILSYGEGKAATAGDQEHPERRFGALLRWTETAFEADLHHFTTRLTIRRRWRIRPSWRAGWIAGLSCEDAVTWA